MPTSNTAPQPVHVFTRQDKYSTVAKAVQGRTGTLLDVGARDRILSKMLDTRAIQYFSADLGPGHDYQFNLEETLPLPDRSFDFVVALDVLEHVEHTHQAFHELARLARQDLIIALPNIASLPRRWSFLWHGHLGTQKYDLLPEHQGDRHRWLTVYSQINAFIQHNAATAGLTVSAIFEEFDNVRFARPLAALGLSRNGWLTGRCIYVIRRM